MPRYQRSRKASPRYDRINEWRRKKASKTAADMADTMKGITKSIKYKKAKEVYDEGQKGR